MVDGMGVAGGGQQAGVVAFRAEVVRREDQDIPGEHLPGVALLQAVIYEAGGVALGAGHMVKGAVRLQEGQAFVVRHHLPQEGQALFRAEAQAGGDKLPVLEAEVGAVA